MENITIFANSTLDFNTQCGFIAGGFSVSILSTALLGLLLFKLKSCACGDCKGVCGVCGGCSTACDNDCADCCCCVTVRWCFYRHCPCCCVDMRRKLKRRVEKLQRLQEEEEAAQEELEMEEMRSREKKMEETKKK